MAINFLNNGVFSGDVTIGALTSGQTARLIVNHDGGAAPVAKFLARTNKAIVQISDNDTTGYVSAENGYFSIGRAAGVHAANINIDGSNNVGIGISSGTSEKLHVYNAGTARIEIEGTTGPAAFKVTNSQGSFGWYVPSDANEFRLWNFGTSTNLVEVNASGDASFVGDITSKGLTVDYTGNRTGDAGILVTNDANDWGIKVDKDGTADYGILSQTDGENAIVVRNAAGTNKIQLQGDGDASFTGRVTASGDPGLVVAGSSHSTIHVASTGTGLAGVYMDASNGDFTGSDYVFIGQDNDKTFRLESFISSGDILLRESNTNTLRLSGGNATFAGDVVAPLFETTGTGYLYLGGHVRLNNPGSGAFKLGQYNGTSWTDTLNITNAGNATFTGTINSGRLFVEQSGADMIDMTRTGVGTYRFAISSSDAFSLFDVGANTDRLVINSSGNATFAGNVTVTGSLSAAGYNIFGLGLSTGTWYGDLGSHGYTRETGLQMTSGSEFVVLSKNGQGSTLVDGAYLAYESANGFFGSYNSSYGNLTGIQATAANTLTVKQLDGGTANLAITSIANATSDTDKFLVSDSGVVKYRTGDQVRSDIGAGRVDTVSDDGGSTINVSGSATARTVAAVTGAVSSSSANLATGAQIQTAINTALTGVLQFEGTWNANTNTPTLTSGSGTSGDYYIVSTAGSTNLDGITDWQIGDWAVFANTTWTKIDNSQVGNVTGAGSSGRVSYWNSNSNITSDADFTFNGADLNLGTQAGTTAARLVLYGTTANNGPSTIKTTNGNLHIDADDGHNIYLGYYTGAHVIVGNGNGAVSGTQFNANGDVIVGNQLTVANGIEMTAGNFNAGDGEKIRLGNSADLQLYHDGSNSYVETTSASAGDFYIKAQGTNHDLYLQSADDIFIRPQGGENGIKVLGNDTVELYFNNVRKLRTTSTGINVEGNGVFSGTLAVTGASTFDNVTLTDLYVSQYIYHNGDTDTFIRFLNNRIIQQAGSGNSKIDFHDNGQLYLYSGGGTALTLDNSQNATFAGKVIGTSGEFTQGVYDITDGLRLINPGGGAYTTTTSSITGAIKITLPVSHINTMMRMTIKVYEYSTNESFTIVCGGYNYYDSNTWYNCFAHIESSAAKDRNFTVRFGHASNKGQIYIGELSSSWTYPQVFITDFQGGYSAFSANNWRSGWDINFETSAFGSVTKSITNTQVNNWARQGADVILGSSSGSVLVTTQSAGNNSTRAASTAFVTTAIANAPQGTITGSGQNLRLALWDGSSSIGSDGDFTYNGDTIFTTKLSVQNQINTNSANLEINYANGDGTTTNFKNFDIRNGKNSQITTFYGSTKNIANRGNNFLIGGDFGNNSYSSTTGARLLFGGGNLDSLGNYYIGTNLEDFGGNYNKLDLRWHTGIRMGAQGVYGGVRIYDSEDLGTVLFSVGSGNGQTGVSVTNNLTVGGVVDFNGVVNSTGVGALIGRNHAYDTLELRGYGAELMIGSQNAQLHINYRTCNNGASGQTPTDWYWRAGSSSSFSNHNFGIVKANSAIRTDSYQNSSGNILFSAGNTTTGAGRSLNLRTSNSASDPSSSDDSNSTGITWGQRSDSNPYYIIYPQLENWNSSGNYSKLTLAWHTGIKIGADSGYGGTRFYSNSPDVSGAGVILNVGVGNSNIGVVHNLTVGGQATGPAPTTTTSYTNKAYVDAAVGAYLPLAGGTMDSSALIGGSGTLELGGSGVTNLLLDSDGVNIMQFKKVSASLQYAQIISNDDKVRLRFRDGMDIYYDDTAIINYMKFHALGGHTTQFKNEDFEIIGIGTNNDEMLFKAEGGGAVSLYHNNVLQLNTTSTGIQTNTIDATVSAGSAGNFVVMDGTRLAYRTAAQVLSDIGATSGAMTGFGVSNLPSGTGTTFTITNGQTFGIVGGANIQSVVNTTNETITLNYTGGTGSGSVTSVATGGGLDGGTITTTGTIQVEYDGVSTNVMQSGFNYLSSSIVQGDYIMVTDPGNTQTYRRVGYTKVGNLPFASSSVVSGVTSVATGSGISGGTITSTGTIQVDGTVIRTTGTQTITGNTSFAPSSTSTSYTNAAIELRESNQSGSSGTPPRISWHHGGVVASSMTIEANGTIAVRNNPGNAYEKFACGNLYAHGGTFVLGSGGTGDMYLGNQATGKYFRFHTNNNQTYFDMNCSTINWREGSSTRYYFYPSTANMTINGTLTQNSDARVKENVVEIDNCISKVQAMKGVYYNRTDFNTDVTKVGVIAQDVEAVLPELILEAPDTKLKSVAYAELTAVLINAIKEQQEIIEDLKTRVQQLEK